jgi:c-di-GMP-binding flagellar brake protein YcgR
MFVDRRRNERKTLQKYCSIECLSEQWSCSGRIKDLSEGGIGVESFKVPRIKDEVHVYMLGDAGEQVRRKAVVAWSRSGPFTEGVSMMGLQFV